MVDFCVDAGNEILRERLATCSKTATYFLKTLQSQLLKCMGDVILDNIIIDVKASRFFAVLAHEVTDESG